MDSTMISGSNVSEIGVLGICEMYPPNFVPRTPPASPAETSNGMSGQEDHISANWMGPFGSHPLDENLFQEGDPAPYSLRGGWGATYLVVDGEVRPLD